MKKLLFVVVLFMMSGCAAMITQSTTDVLSMNSLADDVIKQSYLGMPVKDFKTLAGDAAKIDVLSADGTVYSLEYTGLTLDGGYRVVGKKLFHFDTEGKLIKMDSEDFRKLYLRSGEKEE